MPKKFLEDLPEVFVSHRAIASLVFRELKRGHLRKIESRLYTKNLDEDPEKIVKRNLWPIVANYFPDGLIADRTALENKPALDGSIFLISSKKRKVSLPGITLKPRRGYEALPEDRLFIGGLRLSSPARAFLENMRLSRSRRGEVSRTFSRREIEEKLEALLRQSGESAFDRLIQEMRSIASTLKLEKECQQLEKIMATLLGREKEEMVSPVGIARKLRVPYDPLRLSLFQTLHAELLHTCTMRRKAKTDHYFSFFDAYFSNFIEGTEFELSEAVQILFEGNPFIERLEDAHDVLTTYRIVSDPIEMNKIAGTFPEFLALLKNRHSTLMEARQEKHPGRFKTLLNRAGSAFFVAPELVEGTLLKGFELYQNLPGAFQRAAFLLFFITEVHPFDDGNGRIARIMMNAELFAADECRILFPKVYRNNYLVALKALSQNEKPVPFIRMLDFAQRYSLAVDWSHFEGSCYLLQKTHALEDPNETDWLGLRLELPSSDLLEEASSK